MSTPGPTPQGWLPPTAAGHPTAVREPLPDGPSLPGVPSDPPPGRPSGRERLNRALGPIAVAVAFLLKFAKGLFIVLKGAKFLTTSASMLVSIAAYSLIWGWTFALGFVVLLLIHEMGHAVQMRREGIKTSPIVFVPFMGAVIAMKDLPKDASVEARVGLAGPGARLARRGPLPGALRAHGRRVLAGARVHRVLPEPVQPRPVTPLDGGRAMAALTPWMWFVGLGLVFVMVFTFPSPILILIALIGAFDVYTRWKRRGQPEGREYYKVSRGVRARVALVYVVLLVGLAVGIDATFLDRDFSDV